MTTRSNDALQQAISYLGAVEVTPGRYAYRDDATRRYYVAGVADLAQLADDYDLVRLADGALVPSLEVDRYDLVLVTSDAGDGGWSLHAPGATDEQIAEGDAPALVSDDGGPERPDASDYAAAIEALRAPYLGYDYSRWCADVSAVEMPSWWTPELVRFQKQGD